MRITGKAGLVLISTFALASAAVAGARAEKFHNLMVALPDGSVQHIRYSGDAVPDVVVLPAAAEIAPASLFDPFDASFAELDRMMADMNRQGDAMLRQAALLNAQSANGTARLDPAVIAQMPAGTVSYSFVSTSGGNGNCSQSLQVTSFGANQKPKIVSQSSGNCAKDLTRPLPASQAEPSPALAKPVPARLDPVPAPVAAKPADRT